MTSKKFSSKYRHVFAEAPKAEFQYQDLKQPYTSGEGSYCAVNDTYFAVSKAGGGGPIYVHPLKEQGRVKYRTVNVHKGKALDFQFHPFIPNIIGCASEDASASITQFKDGNPDNIGGEPTVHMKGHTKKVHLMKFAPSANNVMATASWDKTVKLWDASTGECKQTFDSHDGVAFSLAWTEDSKLLAMSSKNKALVVFDPRTPTEKPALEMAGLMEGTKTSKLFWFNKFGWIGATGYNKMAKRQLKIFDFRDMSKPLYSDVVDQQSSVLMPVMDEDTNMLYLWGKGDSSVSFYELAKTDRVIYALGSFRDTIPQKGGAFAPKRALDTQKCEVARFMKLTRDRVIPISFIVPRKTGKDIFQADIFPDCDAGVPGMSGEEYFAGKNALVPRMSMDPANRGDSGAPSSGISFEKKKTYGELVSENDVLKGRIAELEKELAGLKES